ncbi:MAG: 30S ribosomal protein S12 methylthiotransferase RimO [Clostridia bacterium]|nr:30S ribosomal protein S12 methylthiotransferase RimO [Clostridia bacterium]
MKKIGMVSLGCDKNRVDSEKVLYTLQQAGYKVVSNGADADIIIINTCAFIDAAKKVSIDTILEYADLKEKENKKLVVIGCLAQRYATELAEQLPEVDLFVGIDSYRNIAEILEDKFGRVVMMPEPSFCEKGRILTTPAHYAYLKIADGCNNFCSYCAIPFIRGRYRSYPVEALLEEAWGLADQGVKELIVVAQDTTRYGKDLYGDYRLKTLLRKLIELPFTKIRLLYAYPELIDDELIELISTEEKMAKYLDIPLQHIDDNVLKRMNRRSRSGEIYALLDKIKSRAPEIALRSSFIVGFPQESEEEFDKLKSFIAQNYIDYAGFFPYSREENTVAAEMKGQILARIKKAREKELSKLQSINIVNTHKKYLGRTMKVIYEGIDYTKSCFVGRNEYNAPEIDTKVYFTSKIPLAIGEYYNVKITETGFHLKGETVE